MTQNLFKNIICNVALSYQVNLAIEIPNITENYIISHAFTCQHWVSAMLISIYTSHCWEVFLIGQIFFDSVGLGVNQNKSGNLGMKLAIRSSELPIWPTNSRLEITDHNRIYSDCKCDKAS